MTASCIDFDLFYEYINDEDAKRAAESERRWRKKQEEKQARAFYRIVSKIIAQSGITRLFTWL